MRLKQFKVLYLFREPMASILAKHVSDKERWIELTTGFLVKAFG